MSSAISDVIEKRVSANNFDPTATLSDAEVTELIRLATSAPSSFNLQNWRFIAARSAEAKAKLGPAAYGQPKVAAAAVTFIVIGTLSPHVTLAERLEPSVAAGIIDAATAKGWVDMATGMYAGNPQFQRDEAIRSASLAGATLMLAAEGMGLASGAMIGFDPAAVSAAFGLTDQEIPVMLIAVGKAAPGNWPRKPRRPVTNLLTIV